MKKFLLTAVAAVIGALTAFCGVTAFADVRLDSPSYSLNIAEGITYKEQTVQDSGGNQAFFYGELGASTDYELVLHSIRNGSKTTLSTVMDIAKDYEESTGRKVMLATNGDYFDFGSGSNMESYVNDGVVISKGRFTSKHSIGFDNNGKVVVGRMTQTQKRLLVVTESGKRFFNIDKMNEQPADGEIAVYTVAGTYDVKGAGKYIIKSDSVNMSQFPVWGVSGRLTTGTAVNDDPFTVKSGQFAVVVKGEENAKFFFDNVIYGVECSLVEIPDGDFQGCSWVLGGYDILVNDGAVNRSTHTDNDGNGYAPRTFIGFKEDGTAFLCVVDGRQGAYSKGITVAREAEIAKELGAYKALELDGGGSSTMIIRTSEGLVLRNKPSDGQMRKVSNAVMIVEKQKSTGDQPVQPEQPPVTEPPAEEKKPDGASCSSEISMGMAVAWIIPSASLAVAGIIIKKKRSNKR